MNASSLKLAQDARRARGDATLDARIDSLFDELNIQLSQADKVGPAARKKLMPILRKYAKSAKPFTECVNDQLKNGLAKDLANRRCAVLKDIIEGTTKWRGNKTPSKPLAKFLSQDDSCPLVNLADTDIVEALDSFSKIDVLEVLGLKEAAA